MLEQFTLGEPFETDASCSWVAAGTAAGAPCVLKLALPHFEGADEIAGLRFWAGDLRCSCWPRTQRAMSPERIQLWTFARVAVECSHAHTPEETLQLARRLAPT